jgi:hypothetical protein
MRRFALIASMLALSIGCAPSNPALVIDGVIAPTDDCIFDPSSVIFTLSPTLDTRLYSPAIRPSGIRYLAAMRLTSRLIPLFNDRYPLRAEPNVLTLQYADVEILSVDGTPFDFGGLPNPYRINTAGTIAPGTSSAGASGVVGLEIIPPLYGDSLVEVAGRILISVRVTGTTSGGATIESGEYLFPMDLCPGCLVACDPELTTTEAVCLLGQDRTSIIGPNTDPTDGCVAIP